MTDSEHIAILRKELAGMVTLLEILRTIGDRQTSYVMSVGGSMVLVSDAINSANRVLEVQQEQMRESK